MLNTPNSKVRIDVFTSAGVGVGAAGITSAVEFSYKQEIDRIGSFSCRVPAVDPMAIELTQGRELKFYIEDEGLVFCGIVDKTTIEVKDDGAFFVVEGGSIARRLVWDLELTREFDGTAMNTAIDALLSGSGWTRGTTSTPSPNLLLMKIEAASVWKSLEDLALRFGYHLREDLLTETVDVGAMGTVANLMFTNFPALLPTVQLTGPEVVPIAGVSVEDESYDVWNSLVPWGAGEGVNRMTLKQSSRSSPYTIQTTTGADGQTHYYIQDATSVTAYGLRRRAILVKDIQPIANTPAGHEAAANALYDVSVTELLRSKDPQTVYGIACTGMRHLDSGGSYRFQVGDKVRVRYNGVVRDASGTRRAYRSIDQDLWLVSYERTVTDGEDSWSLDVATVDKLKVTGEEQVGQAIEDLYSLKVAVKPYTYREIHGPERRSVASGKNVTFIVDYDENVTYLHLAKLSVAVVPVRVNATGADSEAATSTTANTGHTHTVTAPTSIAASATTSGSNGEHRHQMWGNDPDNTEYDLAVDTSAMTSVPNTGGTNESTSHGHTETGGVTEGNSVPHTHTVGAHTHGLQARGVYMQGTSNPSLDIPLSVHILMYTANTSAAYYTYDSPAAHDHTIPSHNHTINSTTAQNESTHSHTVPTHSHDLVFGIYEGSSPTAAANIGLTINGVSRSVALGGPWDDDFLNLDITQYLVDSDGLPLQQRNTLVFNSSELLDLEIVCKSIVTASALVPQ